MTACPRFLVVALASALPLVGAGAGPAAARDAAEALLERAEAAARGEDFTGRVVVAWRDGAEVRRAEVDVSGIGGVIRLGEDIVGSGAQRLVRGAGGWQTLWRHEVLALSPSPSAKYALAVRDGTPVAGRQTRVLEVRDPDAGALRERRYYDSGTGLLLRQELLDARGRPYRWVGFRELELGAAASAAPTFEDDATPGPEPAGPVEAPFLAPERLGDGYRLAGAYEQSGRAGVHLFYSDGLHALSVFERRGRLTGGALPAGGERMEMGGHNVIAYTTATGEAVVWDGDGVVYTVVSDAPVADVAAAVDDLPHAARHGRLRRVAEAVVSVFRWR